MMPGKRSALLALVVVAFLAHPGPGAADAHSMFNSAEQSYGGYRVQVATAPEFPQVGEPSLFLIKVTEGSDYEDVDGFTMGIRIFYNGQQVDAVPPTEIDGGHWDFDYTWRNIGNHIVKIDLYGAGGDGGVLTYTFNMGTQSPFGFVFIGAITTGAFVFAGIMLYVYSGKIMAVLRR